MFNNKVKLFLVTLIFMLSISAVAAAESNTTDDMAIGEVSEEPPSGVVQDISANDTLEVTDNDVVTADAGYELSGKDVNMYYKNGSCYEVTLTKNSKPVKNATLSVKLNGVTHKLTTDNLGKVSLPITLNTGTYTVTATFKKVSTQNTIKIYPVIKGNKDVSTTYKSKIKYSARFLDNQGKGLKSTNVKFRVNGKTYTKKTSVNGYAAFYTSVLNRGTYTIEAIHPNGYKKTNKIVIKSSISAKDTTKRYKSSKKVSARFYGNTGNYLKNYPVKFYANGKYFNVRTNANGVASISPAFKPGSYKVTIINTLNGQKLTKNLKINPTLYASKVTAFTDKSYQFKVKLYKNEKLVKNAKVYVYIKGVKKVAKTDASGIASVSFKLAKGTYTFKSVDPYTSYSINTKVTVKLASIRAYNKNTYEDSDTTYTATLLNQDGSLAKNTKMQITLNGKTHTVKTNAKGVASLAFKLKEGTYKITCKDPRTGYSITKNVFVYGPIKGIKFNKYGVSEDGKYLLVVGRPSAVGEEEKYGYTFYRTMFERTCPYCHGHNLYWSIFWAGNEHDDGGIFPATGRYETGSAEGNIFCKDCDCDFSVFGNEHVWSNPMHLKIIIQPMKTSKEDAYALKSGNYILD